MDAFFDVSMPHTGAGVGVCVCVCVLRVNDVKEV